MMRFCLFEFRCNVMCFRNVKELKKKYLIQFIDPVVAGLFPRDQFFIVEPQSDFSIGRFNCI